MQARIAKLEILSLLKNQNKGL